MVRSNPLIKMLTQPQNEGNLISELGFQIKCQGRVSIRNSNGSVPTAPPNHYEFSINLSSHVADVVK